MTDENQSEVQDAAYHNVPTVFIDGALGSAWLSGVHRIVLGEFVLNTAQGATVPTSRPVVTLAIPALALPTLIEYLQNLPGAKPDDE